MVFQSTCPRGARHGLVTVNDFALISIHVPTRGTTDEDPREEELDDISIHVPTRGTTGLSNHLASDVKFQSTCPRGARRQWILCSLRLRISIHVPTRGTTPPPPPDHDEEPDISIHVPTRGTTIRLGKAYNTYLFQSTCPRGARQVVDIIFTGCPISIHVPTRGTTCFGIDVRIPLGISIHVPTRGTTGLSNHLASDVRFQSTCPRGARRYVPASLYRKVYFNPRAHEGHDFAALTFFFTINFNPRAHEGHDDNDSKLELKIAISIHVPTRGTTSMYTIID